MFSKHFTKIMPKNTLKKVKGRTVLLKQEQHNVAVLGFDCSSSTIGWGFIGVENDLLVLLAHGHIKPMDSKFPLLERLNSVFDDIELLCNKLSPTHISIEDIFLFMGGKKGKGGSTAQTITILTAFNRIVGVSAFRKANGNVKLFSVHEIRKIIKNSYPEIKKKIEKDDIPNIIVNCLEPKFENIINKKGNVAKETFDESDGIAVAWAYALEFRGKNGSL
jgi:Holliday junction resolvasome RuvABC endonuclease subunit